MKLRLALPGAALAAVVFFGSASATSGDERWAGWIGCWRAEGAPEGEILCIVPNDAGVRLVTIVGGKITGETRMVADAQSRPVAEGGCEGTETAQWSGDGYRVFTRTTMVCEPGVRRSVSGILAMVTPKQWVNVQSVVVGDNPDHALSRTIRYTAVDLAGVPEEIAALATPRALARETVRWASTEPLDIDDVREAVRMAGPHAAEALVLARSEPFDLDGKTLIALDEEGVPGVVIDAMVAVSYPEEFEVVTEPEVPTYYASDDRGTTMFPVYDTRFCNRWGAYDPWMDPYVSSSLCYGDSYLGLSRYGYNFGRYGYGWGYGYRPIIVVRNPNPDTSVDVRRGSVSRSGYRAGSSSLGSARPRNKEPSSSSSTSSMTSRSREMSGSSAARTTTTGGASTRSNSGAKAKPRGSGN